MFRGVLMKNESTKQALIHRPIHNIENHSMNGKYIIRGENFALISQGS